MHSTDPSQPPQHQVRLQGTKAKSCIMTAAASQRLHDKMHHCGLLVASSWHPAVRQICLASVDATTDATTLLILWFLTKLE